MSDLALTMSVPAWLKWQWLCHRGGIEATAYGIPKADDPLYVDDLYVPPQQGTYATTETDEGAMSDFALEMLDRFPDGNAEGVGRLWFHTHPAMSANPSGTDEKTFASDFGKSWAVMAILSKLDDKYARIRVQNPAVVEKVIPIVVDWKGFAGDAANLAVLATRMGAWPAEYEARIRERPRAEPAITVRAAPAGADTPTFRRDGVLYRGHLFSYADWKAFTSDEPLRPARGSRRRPKWTRVEEEEEDDDAHPLLGERVGFEHDGEELTGVVVDNNGEDWVEIRLDGSGERVEMEVSDLTIHEDADDALDRLEREFELEDALDRLQARVDDVDEPAGGWFHA